MLRARVLASLIGLLVLTVLGAFILVAGAVLQPLISNLNDERAEVAVFMVDQAEEAADPERRLQTLARIVQVQVQVYEELPRYRRHLLRRSRRRQIGEHAVIVFPGPHTPIVVAMETELGPRWAVIRFPVDLEESPRRVGLGLLLLVSAAILAAWWITRWVLRPVELAGDGMARVAAGDLGHRLPVNRDITGRIGETFNRMADQVQGLVEGQRQMMAAVSHEVRTPLARLRLHTELLRDAGSPPDRLDAIEHDIEEIDALIEELLESARLDQGAIALRLGPVDLEDIFATALASTDLGERPVQLSVEDGLCVVADERRLLRVCRNLLSNIARYTPPDTPVSISATTTDDRDVWIIVADRGPGVSEEALSRLFDPFFRAEASRSKATGGLGLGLMLVRQIIEAHGGQISAKNREGGGLTVTVRLPTAPPA
ncbi:MAG: signal transduction histidine kinase [Myxococcota bacterium]|jgi:signal transduction histidine kinase